MISTFKKFIPRPLWDSARGTWVKTRDFVQGLGPKTQSLDYCGLKVYYNRGNAIVRRARKEGVFEREMCEAIAADLGKAAKPSFVDIGANIGLVTTYVVSRVPNAVVCDFEPGPAQRSLLEKTVAANNLGANVRVYPQALGEKAGQATFFIHDGKEMGKDSLADTGRGGDARKINVEVSTVDTWWNSNNRPNVSVVKIDTEGAELFVLRGAKEFLKSCKPTIFLEIEETNLRAFPYKASDILSFLESSSYSLFTLNNEKVSQTTLNSFMQKGEDTFVARA